MQAWEPALLCFYRKESFRYFRLITKNLVPTLFQSLLIALPLIILKVVTHQIHSYLPLQSIELTKEVMIQSFPSNILAYLFICLIWGFWEGFNYVVIAEKIRIRFPSPYSWLDSGAITCAIFAFLSMESLVLISIPYLKHLPFLY